MSDFSSMTVVFESPKVTTESVTLPVEVSTLKRVWLKVTRRPLPSIVHTYNVPHFHTVELDPSHYADTVESVFNRMESAGYSVDSVRVDTIFGSDEMINSFTGTPDVDSVSALFRGMSEDEWRSSAYPAHVLEYGWEAENLTTEWMDDHYHGAHDSAAAYAEELVSDCYSEGIKDLPDFVSIDWDDTADNLSSDYDYVRHNGETHVFSRY